MAIYHSVSQLVGNTPLLSVDNYVRQRQLPATILAKLERFNPAGSAKDRIALEMLDQAEATGALQPGGTVIEPTSGNTGRDKGGGAGRIHSRQLHPQPVR